MHKTIASLLLFACPLLLPAQPYAVRLEKNTVYGTAIDFSGKTDTLRLDVFKPVGDGQIKRPLFVYAHGGAWLEVSNKNEAEHLAVCREMAKLGFVAVNVEYRRGYHRLQQYTPYALCASVIQDGRCTFAYDSNEVVRAVYRGMQDLRGAIRYMKGRYAQDSTDVQQVIVGGSSAGGFLALYTAYLDCPGEKPLACGALPPVPTAHPDFASCYTPGPVSGQRPDLGDPQGALHRQNGQDASVVGVANFFGAVFHNLLPGLPGQRLPVLYSFHQTNDVVVDCGVKSPLLSYYEQVIAPLNLCQPVAPPPPAAGSCAILSALQASGVPADAYSIQIVQNGPPNNLANPPGHSFDNLPLRVAQAATFFKPYLNGQKSLPLVPSACTVASYDAQTPTPACRILPTVFGAEGFSLQLQLPQAARVEWGVYDLLGRKMTGETQSLPAGEHLLHTGETVDWPLGPYAIVVRMGANFVSELVFKKE